ncbi:laccase, multicopper oxidase, benzenediol:oxygen oxidorectuctase, partial [Termitomyces sp. T32_za158]
MLIKRSTTIGFVHRKYSNNILQIDFFIPSSSPTGGSPAANPNLNPDLALAILRYKGAPAVEPTTVNVPGIKLFEGDMHPIASEGPGKLGDGPADVALNLQISQ